LFTDDTRISEIAKSLDINVIMTSSDPPNAVYRLSRYAHQLPAHFNTIVNLHGDEPMLDHRNLDHLLESYINQEQTPRVPMVLIKHLDVDIAQLKSEVKVVFDLNNNLLYCSRSLVPHQTKQPDGSRNQYYGIVGLHIIYRESLLKYVSKVNEIITYINCNYTENINLSDNIIDYSGKYVGIHIKTNIQDIYFTISDFKSCCEDFGVYLDSNHKLNDLIGNKLKSIKYDSCNKPKNEEKFIKFRIETNKHKFSIKIYNIHNGYYPHYYRVKYGNYEDISEL
jgi:hypothetical protein